MHDARCVANIIIQHGIKCRRPYTLLQIIKLVYFSHSWMLALHQKPLCNQPIEAWQYGPNISDLYYSIRKYGSDPIDRKIHIKPEIFSDSEKDIIEQVYLKYGNFSGVELSSMAHGHGTPWEQIWNQHKQNTIIPNELIKSYYETLIE